ncbi:hypothetical protein EMCG_03822 [[Emmonsia] crescens]|uniref:Uncharacterized protein n=1 Tax=[Emmonsia] crescens TaxID=73230 RepID=A0A0G2HTZ6_9EURO|nr:hypothetical protein EMCG_03822 [Emmonsia crescens UAMH 3008]
MACSRAPGIFSNRIQNGGDMTTDYYYPAPPAQTPAAPATPYAGSQNPQTQQESGWMREAGDEKDEGSKE